MLGLIKKDFLLLKKTFSWFYVLPIVVFTFSCFQSPELLATLLSIAIFFAASNLAVSTLTLDFQYKWELTVRSLPIEPQDVILSKYILVLILAACALILVVIIEILLLIIFKLSYVTLVLAVTAGLCSTLLFSAILLPVLYRYGVAKMQIAVILYTAVMFLALMLINTQDVTAVFTVLLSNLWLIALGFTALCLIVLGISLLISIRLSKRAFELE